jgi:HEAT repeat protein
VTSLSLLVAADLGLGVTCAVLALLVVAVKLARVVAGSLRAARAAPYRAALIAVAGGEDENGAEAGRLLAMPERDWRVVRNLVVALLGKVRGDSAGALIGLLDAHGDFGWARSAVRSRRSLRRAAAAHLLGLAARREDAVLLLSLLTDRSAEVRLGAARSLGSAGDPNAAAALFDALAPARGHPGIPAAVAAEALLSFGVRAGPAVLQALAASDVTVRAVAAMVAAEGTLIATAPRLRHLLGSDPELKIRVYAARALGVVGGAEDVAGLAAQTAPDQPAAIRRAAVQALGELGHQDAAPVLAALLADPDVRLAQHSGDALARLRNEVPQLADGPLPARHAGTR